MHVGRAVFDGRFSDLELNNLGIAIYGQCGAALTHAQSTYGPDAQPLLPLTTPDPDLTGELGLTPQAGALRGVPQLEPAGPPNPAPQRSPRPARWSRMLDRCSTTAPLPFRVVGPDTDLAFDPASYFFFQDNRRCYFVESQKYYWTGSAFSPVVPSDPSTVPYEVRYGFHVFYHPFTRLFWNQLAGGGFDLLYDPNLQQNPDQIDPSGADVFSLPARLPAIRRGSSGTTMTSRARIASSSTSARVRLTRSTTGSCSITSRCSWPSCSARTSSSRTPRPGSTTSSIPACSPATADPVPQRFWIPKPLHNLTSAQILAQQINNLLEAVNQGDPTAVAEVQVWRKRSVQSLRARRPAQRRALHEVHGDVVPG